ncbi:MAG: hypothetical protein EXS55_02505 [Candidatus Magasanikbacteria bacterium]|nr:hypothetical protein [Candidatus Magasanikbacteria bacterium]
MKKFIFLTSTFFSMTLLLGAGCFSSTAPDKPGYNKDAEEFRQPYGGSIPTTYPAYRIPGPATTTIPGQTQPTTVDGTGEAKVPLSVPVKSQNYTEAINKYQHVGAYFQFVQCHGIPGVINIKRGTNFMIDNRDTVPHIFKIGTTSYDLGPYDYAIAVAPRFPLKYFITCDGGGAAQIYVQG